ncbi:MAG: TonB-dependent receptor domain-containing protein [Gemmatimonadota bacterium]
MRTDEPRAPTTDRSRARGRRADRVALLSLLLAAGSWLPASLHGQQTGTIRGRIVDRQGIPVAEASVFVDATRRDIVAGRDGRFVVRGLAPGTHTLRVVRYGFEPAERAVRVVAGRRSAVEIVLRIAPVAVEAVTVIGSLEEHAELRRRLRDIPGAVALIEPEEIERTRQANLKDVLGYTPGVYIAPRFGAADESQLSIRGSGLRNNFHLRGVNILMNGMPYRNADGFTDFESLELLTTDHIQVYKGGNALRYGGSTLGGAINLVTKTGYTAAPFRAFAQGGSHGFLKAQAASGAVLGDFDYYASYAHTEVDGFREFAHNERERVNLHAGVRVSDAIDARLFYFFAWVREELPGSLTRDEVEEDPRQANATNVANEWGRDYTLHHLGLQLRSRLGTGQRLDIAPYFQYRDIVHPIFRVLDQDSRDVGLAARYENANELFGRGSRFTLGLQHATGEIDNRHFENEGGESGALAKHQRDEASTIAVYAEEVLDITDRVSAVAGLRWDRSRRSVDDFYLDDGDQTDERHFEALMPKIGLVHDLPAIGGQLFANASRAYEPPLLLELNSFTLPGFIDLDAQDAWQFEVGTRGSTAGLAWDLALYDIELRDEIINLNVPPFPDAPFTVPTYRNADETRHVGIEAALEYDVPISLSTRSGGDELGLRLAYTYGRFTFVDDPELDGNEIPGIPHHVLRAGLAYRHPVGLTLRPNIEWVPSDYFVNAENSVTNEGWTLLGLRGEWALEEAGARFFVELRNLTDEVYSPAVNVDDASGRFFQPGDGRSVYVGLQYRP